MAGPAALRTDALGSIPVFHRIGPYLGFPDHQRPEKTRRKVFQLFYAEKTVKRQALPPPVTKFRQARNLAVTIEPLIARKVF